MTDIDRDGLELNDEDRLPWLETADGYEYDDSSSPVRVAALILLGIVLIGAVVGAIYWIQDNKGAEGNGQLIAAPEGPVKVKPQDAGGKSFEGEGDVAFAASDGKKVSGTIAVAAPEPAPTPVPASEKTAATTEAPAAAAYVQLGAYSSAEKGELGWQTFSRRFDFLSGMKHRVAQGTGEGGRTVHRLQVATADSNAARQLCAQLKAAGEACLIVR